MKITLKFNKEEANYHSVKDVVSSLFSLSLSYTYSSIHAMRDNFITCCDLITEICTELRPTEKDEDSKKFKMELSRIVAKMKRLKTSATNINDYEVMRTFIYDSILSIDGNGRLHGFGFMSKHGDKIKGNAEKLSVTAR